MKKKIFVITGYYDFEEREAKTLLRGIIVVSGGEDMRITQINEE